MLDKKIKNDKIIYISFISIFIFFVVIQYKLVYSQNPDIYFMLNHGKYIIENGFPTIEPFTIHENLTFQIEKWLTCISLYYIYQYTGLLGLNIIRFILLVLTIYIIYIINNYVGKNTYFNLINIGLYLLLFNDIRPQLISNILLLLEFYFLEKWINTKNIKYLYILPIISCILINVHSTMYPIFYLIIIPFIFQNLQLESNTFKIKDKLNIKNIKALIVFSILSILSALLNPYTYNTFIYIYNSYKSTLNVFKIEELQPISWEYTLYFFSIIIIVSIHIICLLKKPQKIPFRYICLFYGFLLFALMHCRNLQYFLLFSNIMLAYNYKDIKLNSLNLLYYITLIYISCIIFMSQFNSYLNAQNNLIYINKLNIPIYNKIFTDYNIGAYDEWLGYKCYIDSRSEIFTKDINKQKNILTEYNQIIHGVYPLDEIQKKYNFDIYHINKSSYLYYQLKKSNNWKILKETDEQAVFKHLE